MNSSCRFARVHVAHGDLAALPEPAPVHPVNEVRRRFPRPRFHVTQIYRVTSIITVRLGLGPARAYLSTGSTFATSGIISSSAEREQYEVEHLDAFVLRSHDVFRFEVAVDTP